MWSWMRKKRRPSTRDLLLEIIPKVELVPVVVPDKYEIPTDFKPPEPKTLSPGKKRTKAAEKEAAAKSPPKKKKSGKASSEAKAMTDKYSSDINALDEEKASNIIKTHK